MAERDFAIRPKTILKRLRRIAPDVDIDVEWTPDPYFEWDGDGPDPAEEGYVAHDVEVRVTVTDQEGEQIAEGSDFLVGVYARPGEEDSEYFTGMLYEAIEGAARALTGRPEPFARGRKEWDPREPNRITQVTSGDPYFQQLRAAAAFVKRSSEEIYRRNMEYHRRRDARERRGEA